ncbi:radiation-inducible immediate-early gene IEX-1 [Centroberyx affinis]|uniref:radiation-inducible immediate-early gene IEX-1 n=1 Tax=Centroberyx affinis TaxID=166261 RepID=UPI003A5C0F49
MYTRSNSMTLSIPTTRQESFSYSRVAAVRSKEPEIFTFERIPAQATAVRSYAPIRPKKRCTRVMYPATVRKYLPPAEKSPAKRWLVILCLVVLWQIYTEEPCVETPLGSTDSPASDYQVLPFQSAEEQARQLTDASASEGLTATSSCKDKLTGHGSSSWDQILLNTTCLSPSLKTEMSRMYEQSTRNGYMVALLVYHRLGSDN